MNHPLIKSVSEIGLELSTSHSVRKVGRIIHCVNPFPARLGSEHDFAQRMTIRSMVDAKTFAMAQTPAVDIELQAAILSEDQKHIDLRDFHRVTKLSRKVTDIATFSQQRLLPLIYDIVNSIDLQEDDIGIYTNIDITLTPSFYSFVAHTMSKGYDALIINRRTISKSHLGFSELSITTAEIGQPHPGYDCFVFSKRLQQTLPEHTSCIGIKTVAVPILFHLVAASQKPALLYDAHLTFHFGDDQTWKNADFADYEEHNRREYKRIISQLLSDPENKKKLTHRFGNIPDGVLVTGNVRNFVDGPEQKPLILRRLTKSVKRHVNQLFE